MNTLAEIGAVPVDFSLLKAMYPNHKSIHNKISELENAGKLIRLKKGLYVVAPQESGMVLSSELIANHLYGPSYVSKESALRYYGLIPEQVYTLYSMTTKHARSFTNALGTFGYSHCSNDYFTIGIRQESKEGLFFLMATPEKALCDLIINTPNLNLRYQKEIRTYLEEDIRFDMQAFFKMDVEILKQCLLYGKKKPIITNLIHLIRKS